MSRRDRTALVVEFFETASLEQADVVLAICRHLVARRRKGTLVPRLKRDGRKAPEKADRQLPEDSPSVVG